MIRTASHYCHSISLYKDQAFIYFISLSTFFTPDYHSWNLPSIVEIRASSSTLGATQDTVTLAAVWFIDPRTNPNAIDFITMNSTCSTGMEQVWLKVSKETTRLLLGRLKANSKKAINLIFCCSFSLLTLSSSLITVKVHGQVEFG